jgi:hypothetical protein
MQVEEDTQCNTYECKNGCKIIGVDKVCVASGTRASMSVCVTSQVESMSLCVIINKSVYEH